MRTVVAIRFLGKEKGKAQLFSFPDQRSARNFVAGMSAQYGEDAFEYLLSMDGQAHRDNVIWLKSDPRKNAGI